MLQEEGKGEDGDGYTILTTRSYSHFRNEITSELIIEAEEKGKCEKSSECGKEGIEGGEGEGETMAQVDMSFNYDISSPPVRIAPRRISSRPGSAELPVSLGSSLLTFSAASLPATKLSSSTSSLTFSRVKTDIEPEQPVELQNRLGRTVGVDIMADGDREGLEVLGTRDTEGKDLQGLNGCNPSESEIECSGCEFSMLEILNSTFTLSSSSLSTLCGESGNIFCAGVMAIDLRSNSDWEDVSGSADTGMVDRAVDCAVRWIPLTSVEQEARRKKGLEFIRQGDDMALIVAEEVAEWLNRCTDPSEKER